MLFYQLFIYSFEYVQPASTVCSFAEAPRYNWAALPNELNVLVARGIYLIHLLISLSNSLMLFSVWFNLQFFFSLLILFFFFILNVVINRDECSTFQELHD